MENVKQSCGLTVQEIEEIRKFIQKYPEIYQAKIFGSRALGSYKEASDVDIAIFGDGVTEKTARDLKFDIEEESYLPYFFDVISYNDITVPSLREHIDRHGVTIYRQGWREYIFSDFVDINPPVKLNKGEWHSYVEMKDLNEKNKYCFSSAERKFSGGSRFQDGDTLFARITPCLENGKICQVKGLKNGVGFGSTEFYVFRGRDKISDTDFIFYLSRWDEVREFAEMNFDGTSGRQRVPKSAFDKLELLLPPLPEQKAVADILSSLDDKIELLHRQNKTLEDMAETIFKKWFLKEASDDWEEGKLGEIIVLNYGKALPERERRNGSVPVYSSAGLTGWHDQCLVDSGGIVVGRKGTIGTIYLVYEPFYCIDTAYYITPNDTKYDLAFIYYLLQTLGLKDMNEDSAVPGLNRNTVYSQDILIPPEHLIKRFSSLANTILQRVQSNNAQIHTLEKLRDTLLPKLISGEVRVNV